MKGFRIVFNNEEISAAAHDGHTMISVNGSNDGCLLYTGGYDHTDHKWRVWSNRKMTSVDKLDVTVAEIEECSAPVEERLDYTVSRRFPDAKLDRFRRLEEELKNKGLI